MLLLKLNLAEILKRKAAFVSISQNNESGGALGHENHRERGSLPATIKTLKAARKASNFVSFNWIGYNIYRGSDPQNIFDKVQYETWVEGLNVNEEKRQWDNELVDELQELVEPDDLQSHECALQTSLIGTPFPLELARKRVEVIVFKEGVHRRKCSFGT